jgi:hypothetical protein
MCLFCFENGEKSVRLLPVDDGCGGLKKWARASGIGVANKGRARLGLGITRKNEL